MACKWIIEKQTPPPVPFQELVDSVAEENIKPVIAELVRIKTNIPETQKGNHIPELDEYIKNNIPEIKKYADSIPCDKNNDWSLLDEIFLKCIDLF